MFCFQILEDSFNVFKFRKVFNSTECLYVGKECFTECLYVLVRKMFLPSKCFFLFKL
ncbi:unnamed protein product [Meloidogyne enterolobii]|uniref:Uncharacterized protein n=1 Tax=Meloidogyne enterolobii TaxID=390850 RepID=A0ACB1AQR4_MELEN